VKAAIVWRCRKESATSYSVAPYLVFVRDDAWPRFKRAVHGAYVEVRDGRVGAFARLSSIERWGYAAPLGLLTRAELPLEAGAPVFFESLERLRSWWRDAVVSQLGTARARRRAEERLEALIRHAEGVLGPRSPPPPRRRGGYRAVKLAAYDYDEVPPGTRRILRLGALLARDGELELREYSTSYLVARKGRDEVRLLFVRKGADAGALLAEAEGKEKVVLSGLRKGVELARLAGAREAEELLARLAAILSIVVE
jgi:hypothetical protein